MQTLSNIDEVGQAGDKLKKDLSRRLNLAEGQVRGIKAMIERGDYCDDILMQIASVQSAMGAVGRLLLEEHMKTCVARRLKNGDEAIVEEFVKTVARFYK